MRYLRGFIQIQEMVDRAIIKLQAGDNSPIAQVNTQLQQMPATCYMEDDYMGYLYPYVIPVIMALAWLFAVAHAIKNLTAYKESGLEEVESCPFTFIHLYILSNSIDFLLFSC